MAANSAAFAVALGHHRAGNLQLAERSYRQILQLDPGNADALHYLGVLTAQSGNQSAAIELIGKAIRINPGSALYHYHLGNSLQAHGDLAAAELAYRNALRLKPHDAQAQSNLGHVLRLLGRHAEAVAACQQALTINPSDARAHNNLGTALQTQGELEPAICAFQRALELEPGCSEFHSNLGNALQENGQLDHAVIAYARALALQPQNAQAHNNLGNSLRAQGRVAAALACYSQAAELAADFALARHNRAMAWLLLGNFDQGWPEYEWRWQAWQTDRVELRQPTWNGGPLEERTILLWAEQGIGDTFQFVRYAPLVKQQGGRVVLRCAEQLVPILASCRGIDQFDCGGTEECDVQAPLMSLPHLLHTRLDSIPAEVPYLVPDEQRVQHWRSLLGRSNKFRVGIAWQGNPQQGADKERSIPLLEFTPLAQVSGVELYSLQKGFGCEQLETMGERLQIRVFADEFDATGGAFMDSAAVMTNLDLVITCDSALCHLAGALGVPVWVALPYAPDWRWLLDREDSPWYPTMRLFRQPTRGDWPACFLRMAAELRSRVESRRLRLESASS